MERVIAEGGERTRELRGQPTAMENNAGDCQREREQGSFWIESTLCL